MIKAVIVEDEEKGLNNLKAQLRNHSEEIQVIAEANSIREGLDVFSRADVRPDVAFLDIDLPDGLVFQMLEKLRPVSFDIIFVTGHKDFAIRACEFSSIGYITKPIDPDRLREALDRIRPNQNNKIDQRLEIFNGVFNNPNAFEKLSISAVDGIYFLNIRDIVRFEAEDNYTHIFLSTGERITASKTIKSYEDLMSPVNFYRVHKRHMINLNFIRKFVKGEGGYLIMEDGIKIDVSRRRRGPFMERLKVLHEAM